MLTVEQLVAEQADPAARLVAMVAETVAKALRVAPCLDGLPPTDPRTAEVDGILRKAIARRTSPAGELRRKTNGPFSKEYRDVDSSSVLTDAEISELQSLCGSTVLPIAGITGAALPVGVFPAGSIDRVFR